MMGSITVIYTIADECNNATTKTATFTIIDNNVPTVNCNPINLVFECKGETENQQIATQWNAQNINDLSNCSFDNCSTTFSVYSNFDYNLLDLNCQEESSLTVTYTIADECDNIITKTATLTKEITSPITPSCENIKIESTNNQLTISNLSAPNTITKVFDPNWQIISNCSGDCPETVTIPNLIAGETYYTDIQFYDENWEFICEDKRDVEIIDGGNEPCDTSICQGDVILRTQAEVDAFCGCEVIEGKLEIGDNRLLLDTLFNITSLEALNKIREIKGSLIIGNTAVSNFEGLMSISKVNGAFVVVNNIYLEAYKGISNLVFVKGNFVLIECPVIENFTGLENLKYIGGQMSIDRNDNLKNFKGLSNLEDGLIYFNITHNSKLISFEGLEKLDSIVKPMDSRTSGINISKNISLQDISGLENIKYVGSSFILVDNSNLGNCCSIYHLINDDPNDGKVDGQIAIYRNSDNFCDTREAILQNCQTSPPTCENIQIITQNNQITITGLTAPNEIVKVFDKNYNIVYQCNANCDTQMAGTFPLGAYVIDLQLYDENWGLICAEQRTVVLENNNPCDANDCETTPPVFANIPADLTVECDDIIPPIATNITATDNCDVDVYISFVETADNNNCPTNIVIVRTWTATDNCDNTASAQQIVTIVDNTPPVLTNLPPDLTFNASEGFDTTFPIPTDNCDTDPTLTVEDVVNSEETELVRTFTATDNCGNTATAQQIITIIQDNSCANILITTSESDIKLANITAPNTIVKVFDPNWQFVYECNATCENEIIVPVAGEGIYHTDIQFYDENWQFVCLDKQDVEVFDGGEPCDTSICAGDVVLHTQAEVAAFCGCEVIEGDLYLGLLNNSIELSDINSLKKLNKIKLIKGIFSIVRTSLVNLEGLENIKNIETTLGIINNPKLKNLKGLEQLEKIHETLAIVDNDDLETFTSLNNLKEIGNQINIQKNDKIINLNGLLNIRNANAINIIQNSKLLSLDGLNNLDSITNHFSQNSSYYDILNNQSLVDISALNGIKLIIGNLNIGNNYSLTNCCPILHLIDENPSNGKVTGFIGLANNEFGFCNSSNEILQNCQNQPSTPCEITQISTVNDTLNISNLTATIEILKVFDANYNIIYQCFADCEDNISIPDLAAGTYHISINFYDENWQPICEKNETVEIASNAQDRTTDLLPTDFALFPNPAAAETYIDLSKLKEETVQLELFNQFGQRVQQQVIEKVSEQKVKIDLTTVQNGLYILKIEAKGRKSIAKKLIVNRLY